MLSGGLQDPRSRRAWTWVKTTGGWFAQLARYTSYAERSVTREQLAATMLLAKAPPSLIGGNETAYP